MSHESSCSVCSRLTGETGWCIACSREVYDGENEAHVRTQRGPAIRHHDNTQVHAEVDVVYREKQDIGTLARILLSRGKKVESLDHLLEDDLDS